MKGAEQGFDGGICQNQISEGEQIQKKGAVAPFFVARHSPVVMTGRLLSSGVGLH